MKFASYILTKVISSKSKRPMDALTSPQRKAVNDALALLRSNNVRPETFSTLHLQALQSATDEHNEGNASGNDELPQPSLAIQKASYRPPKAVYFTELERLLDIHRVTRKSFVSAVIDHPEGVAVEYPEAGKEQGDSIAHRFTIDPSKWINPKSNIQYSLGDKHGGRDNVTCYLLRDSVTGEPIKCKKRSYGCEFD